MCVKLLTKKSTYEHFQLFLLPQTFFLKLLYQVSINFILKTVLELKKTKETLQRNNKSYALLSETNFFSIRKIIKILYENISWIMVNKYYIVVVHLMFL